MSMLGLADADYRIIGLALGAYPATPVTGPADTSARDRARALLLRLIRSGFITGTAGRGEGERVEPSHVLGMEPEDFRVIGLALAAFAAPTGGNPPDDAHDCAVDDEDREQAELLHELLIDWGHLPRQPAAR